MSDAGGACWTATSPAWPSALLPLPGGGGRSSASGAASWPGGWRTAAGCWWPATAAAPPRPSTSPPNWSASSATTGPRCPPSRCAPRPSALTAIGNDYGYEEVFARQVRAHGRPGRHPAAAVHQRTQRQPAQPPPGPARELGLRCWAFTGPAPNPLAEACARRARRTVARPARWCRSCTWSPPTCSASTSRRRCRPSLGATRTAAAPPVDRRSAAGGPATGGRWWCPTRRACRAPGSRSPSNTGRRWEASR